MNQFCSASGSEFEPQMKRRREPNRIWQKIQEFDSSAAAVAAVQNRGSWMKSSGNNSVEGNKVYYRCTSGAYRTKECPGALYLFYHADTAKVSLFETKQGHDNHVTDPTRGRRMR